MGVSLGGPFHPWVLDEEGSLRGPPRGLVLGWGGSGGVLGCQAPLTVAAGLGAPGGGCGVPPSARCQDWVTALRCGALGRCPLLGQGPPEVLRDAPSEVRPPPVSPAPLDACALCQQLLESLRKISNQSAVEDPLKVCTELKLCPEPGAVPVLEGPGSHLQYPLSLCSVPSTLQVPCPCTVSPVPVQCPLSPALSPVPVQYPLSLYNVPCPCTVSPVPQGSGLSPLSLPLPRCWLCRSLVARAEAAVPVRSVAAAVAGLCRALPLPLAGACQCLAERYAELALEGLLGRLGPRLLCRLFLACSGSGDSGDSGDSQHEGTLPPPWALEAIVVRLADCVREEAVPPSLQGTVPECTRHSLGRAPGGVPTLGGAPHGCVPPQDPKGATVPALSLSLGPCALGPMFWCSGPEAARRCQVRVSGYP
ncbi:pulmonary surfactant-associated protein B [Agelaius tricolor]|uniref:pulmonary surfactant-associated protein B n=1 Tax=Agelaius tricolor TaxID=9191 RepID=UPI0039F1EC27